MDKEFFFSILKNTADALHIAYKCNQENKCDQKSNYEFDQSCRLVFPKKRDGSSRISEQELRFEFIHQLLKKNQDRYWYSIETPTGKSYSGFVTGQPVQDDNGQSGEFDLSIFDKKGERITLVEFKAHNPKPADYQKDLLKMNTEGKNTVCYFIQLLKSVNSGTFKNIINKKLLSTYQNTTIENINYFCIVLDKNEIYQYNARIKQIEKVSIITTNQF